MHEYYVVVHAETGVIWLDSFYVNEGAAKKALRQRISKRNQTAFAVGKLTQAPGSLALTLTLLARPISGGRGGWEGVSAE